EPFADMLMASVRASIADPSQRSAFERAAHDLSQLGQRTRVAASFGWGGGSREVGGGWLLRYPLRVGGTWTVGGAALAERRPPPRESPRSITGLDRVTTPAGAFSAWRTRAIEENGASSLVNNAWYAHQGLVRMVVHGESIANDENGRSIGRLIVDWDEEL